MGSRGPVPKRSDQRRRRNSSKTQKHVAFVQSVEDKVKELVATHTRDQLAAMAAAEGIDLPGRPTKAVLAEALVDVGADPEWHPVAKAWFESLADSGQSEFYQPSDWAVARLLAEAMSRDLKPQIVGMTEDGDPIAYSRPLNGASISAYLKGFSTLLVTEADRRRVQLELQSPKQPEPVPGADAVSILDDYRNRTG